MVHAICFATPKLTAHNIMVVMPPNIIKLPSPLSNKAGTTTEANATWAVSAIIADSLSNTALGSFGPFGTNIKISSPINYHHIA